MLLRPALVVLLPLALAFEPQQQGAAIDARLDRLEAALNLELEQHPPRQQRRRHSKRWFSRKSEVGQDLDFEEEEALSAMRKKGLLRTFRAAANVVVVVNRLKKAIAGGKVKQSPKDNDDLGAKAVEAFNAKHPGSDIVYVKTASTTSQTAQFMVREFCIDATAGGEEFTFRLKIKDDDGEFDVIASEGAPGSPRYPGYKCLINGIDDLLDEFQSLERGDQGLERNIKKSWVANTAEELAHFPESFDAREEWPRCKGIIENVKNQGGCGSCYAFSGTGAASIIGCVGKHAQMIKNDVESPNPSQFESSQQQIMDCARKSDDNVKGGTDLMMCYPGDKGGGTGDGCDGGQEWAVMDYMDSTPMARETGYQYVFGEGDAQNHMDKGKKMKPKQPCKKDDVKKDEMITGGLGGVHKTRIIDGERAMMAAIQTFGAITVSFDTYSDIYKMTGNTKTPDMSNTVYYVKQPVEIKDDKGKVIRGKLKDGDAGLNKCVLDDVVEKNGAVVSCTTYKDCRDCTAKVPGRGGEVCKCAVLVGGHAVVAIGWGEQDDNGDKKIQPEEKYWLLRNSWGTGIGEGGIFKYARGINFGKIEEKAALAMPKRKRDWHGHIDWEDAMFPKGSRCLHVRNGDEMKEKHDPSKCLVSNVCDEWVIGRFVSGGDLYSRGSDEKPRNCRHTEHEPASAVEYLVPPNQGYSFVDPPNERFPFSRCSVVDSKKIGAESSAKVQAWFDTSNGKALHQYVGEAKTTRKGAVCKCKTIIVKFNKDSEFKRNAELSDGRPSWTGTFEKYGKTNIWWQEKEKMWVFGGIDDENHPEHNGEIPAPGKGFSSKAKIPGTNDMSECPSDLDWETFEVRCK